MKVRQINKLVLCLSVYILLTVSYKIVKANDLNDIAQASRVESYISSLYKKIDFGNATRLSFDVFSKAMRGYLNLKNAGKLNNEKELLTVCDFNQPSVVERLWVIDLAGHKVLYNTFVAHGQATGDDCAMQFSNKMNSHKSSLGFYVTLQDYTGDHGTSLRLQGMDQGYNDAALKRDIVMHGADYVSERFICNNQRLGRSWGCPAVPLPLAVPIVNTIKDGTCLFIYYPEPKYLSSGYWVNKKIASLPEGDVPDEMMPTDLSRLPFKG